MTYHTILCIFYTKTRKQTEDRVRAGRDHLAHRRARRDRDALVRAGRHLLLDGGLPVALAVLGVHLLVEADALAEGEAVRVWIESLKAERSKSAVSTAEPMAKPLPVAAVVLPSASSESVMARTSLPRKAISARPPALSATGP